MRTVLSILLAIGIGGCAAKFSGGPDTQKAAILGYDTGSYLVTLRDKRAHVFKCWLLLDVYMKTDYDAYPHVIYWASRRDPGTLHAMKEVISNVNVNVLSVSVSTKTDALGAWLNVSFGVRDPLVPNPFNKCSILK